MEYFSFLQHYAAIFSFFRETLDELHQTQHFPSPTSIHTLRLEHQEGKNTVQILVKNSKRHVKTT